MGNVVKFDRDSNGDIILTNEQREFIKAVYGLAKLSISQLETLQTLEKTWGVTLVAYERKE